MDIHGVAFLAFIGFLGFVITISKTVARFDDHKHQWSGWVKEAHQDGSERRTNGAFGPRYIVIRVCATCNQAEYALLPVPMEIAK